MSERIEILPKRTTENLPSVESVEKIATPNTRTELSSLSETVETNHEPVLDLPSESNKQEVATATVVHPGLSVSGRMAEFFMKLANRSSKNSFLKTLKIDQILGFLALLFLGKNSKMVL